MEKYITGNKQTRRTSTATVMNSINPSRRWLRTDKHEHDSKKEH
uniref:Uncharacterized protein n=1 Tax=Nelumbo nucifera TaxID=4432 RepID=A0A822YCZ9_NELNU|nr:TPA_asm: hypothetical protein HUJ06_030323 [Nelumbo nucifera]